MIKKLNEELNRFVEEETPKYYDALNREIKLGDHVFTRSNYNGSVSQTRGKVIEILKNGLRIQNGDYKSVIKATTNYVILDKRGL